MSQEALNTFGRIAMKEMRDAAITDWRMTLDGRMKDQESIDIRNRLENLSEECQQLVHELIPKVVDTTMHHMMWTFERHEDIDLGVQLPTGYVKSLRDESDGLAGELYGGSGWIARFSSAK